MPPLLDDRFRLFRSNGFSVLLRKILKDKLIYSNITNMEFEDELPSSSVFIPVMDIYDPQSGRSYKIRLSNGKINPRAASILLNRFNQGTMRQYINTTYLQPNNLRIVGNRVYDMSNRADSQRFRNALNRQRQVAIAERNEERRRAERRRELRTATNIIRNYRATQVGIPVAGGSSIDRINDRTRIFRFTYTLNQRGMSLGNWSAQVAAALEGSNYLEGLVGFNTRTQIVISALPTTFGIDAHLGGNHLRTTYEPNSAAALASIIAKKQSAEEEYEGLDWDFETILVNRIITPLGGQGGGRSEAVANKTWLALDKKSKTNCFYNSVSAIRLFTKKTNEGDNEYKLRIETLLSDIPETMKKVGDLAKNLKRGFQPSITNIVDLRVIKEYVDYVYGLANQPNIYIQLYNNIFEKIYTIVPTGLQVEDCKKYRRFEIQLINNHYIPLIRWKDIGVAPYISPPVSPVNSDEDEDYVIKKYNNKKNKQTGEWEKIVIPYNKKIAAYDIEATPNGNPRGDFTNFCVSFVWRDIEPPYDIIRKSWYGLDCIKHFIDYVSDNMDFFTGYTIYAHNNGKFDMIQVFKDYLLTDTTCPLKINPEGLIPLNGAYIGVSTYNEVGEVKWKDSLKMLPAALAKLAQEFNVPHKKLDKVKLPDGREVAINHDEVNIHNIDDYDIKHSQREYCEWDSMCLLEILELFSKDVYEATGLNITDCFTGASLSKKHYYKNFYNKFRYPIYHLSTKNDKFIRNSYYGGRNEAHYIGKYNHKVYYYDFTSLYPSEGRLKLPYGSPSKVNPDILEYYSSRGGEWNSMSALPFGFYKVKVKTLDTNRKPLHAIKNNGRLTFPIFEDYTEITLFSEEIKLGFKCKQYDYQFLEGIQFKSSKFMKEFFIDGFSKKGKAKAEGLAALALCYKIIINSGYGFWGLNTLGKDGIGRDGVNIYEKDTMDFWDLLNSGGLVNIGTMGNYNIVRANKELEIADFNVGVASAITSWARIRIWNFIDDIEKKGGKILYMDTDSAIINISMKEHQDIMKEYCWDGNGDELGSMKNEADDEVMDYFKGKVKKENPDWDKDAIKSAAKVMYKKQEELDGGDLHWDRFIGGGCKQYALQKICYDGGKVEICKMKGYSKGNGGRKLKYEDFTKLINAYWKQREIEDKYEKKCKEMMEEIREKTNADIISQEQVQFRCPLSYHLTDIRVEKWKVKKEFRVGYTKGIVQRDGWVKPLRL
jgi:hypothetical protein